jgi:hypothetical protein
MADGKQTVNAQGIADPGMQARFACRLRSRPMGSRLDHGEDSLAEMHEINVTQAPCCIAANSRSGPEADNSMVGKTTAGLNTAGASAAPQKPDTPPAGRRSRFGPMSGLMRRSRWHPIRSPRRRWREARGINKAQALCIEASSARGKRQAIIDGAARSE